MNRLWKVEVVNCQKIRYKPYFKWTDINLSAKGIIVTFASAA